MAKKEQPSTTTVEPTAPSRLCPEIVITTEERVVLKKLLERDETSRIVHGGLGGLLSFSHDDCETLLGFLRRI